MWTVASHAPHVLPSDTAWRWFGLRVGPGNLPDGKWIAYLSNARGSVDVWVRFPQRRRTDQLTATTTLEIQSRTDLGGLAISPDGSMIAFEAGATRGPPARFDAWAIPAPVGGTPRKIVELGRACAGHRRDADRICPAPEGPPEMRCTSHDPMVAVPREVVALRGAMHITGRYGPRTGDYIYFNYSISTANREPASIYRVAAQGGPVEPWCRPRGARSLPCQP
jgi:hypothetical protein